MVTGTDPLGGQVVGEPAASAAAYPVAAPMSASLPSSITTVPRSPGGEAAAAAARGAYCRSQTRATRSASANMYCSSCSVYR